MKNRKTYLRRRTKLIARLMAVLDSESKVPEAESVWLNQEARFKLVEITYQKEATPLVLMLPGRIRLLWILPAQIPGNYDYCPDQRIMTHRLIGKPALGPSPPSALNVRRGEGATRRGAKILICELQLGFFRLPGLHDAVRQVTPDFRHFLNL